MANDVQIGLGDFTLERGDVLQNDVVTGRLYGQSGAPLIIVLGGISATRFVADGGRNNRGWWSNLVHRGGAIDLNKFQVLGYDFAPSPRSDNRPSCITTADQARRVKALLDHIGVAKATFIGSSYGGMVGLQFARLFPEALSQLCVISAAHRPYPIGVGWRGIQRRVVRLAIGAGRPKDGLKLARELAMTTYRTPEEFADRFSLAETSTTPCSGSPANFDICDYLSSRGDAFAEQMDAARFLALSESIDLHRVEPEDITTPTLLMTAISDQLAPLSEMQELRDRLDGPSELYTFTSLYGHDAFLKEWDAMAPRLAAFCEGITQ